MLFHWACERSRMKKKCFEATEKRQKGIRLRFLHALQWYVWLPSLYECFRTFIKLKEIEL